MKPVSVWDGSREDIFRNRYSLCMGRGPREETFRNYTVSAWCWSREDTIRNGYSLHGIGPGRERAGIIQSLHGVGPGRIHSGLDIVSAWGGPREDTIRNGYSLCMGLLLGNYIQEGIWLILNQEKLQKAFLWILKKNVTFLFIRIDYRGLERGLGG